MKPSEALRRAHRDGVVQSRGRLPLPTGRPGPVKMCAIAVAHRYGAELERVQDRWPFHLALEWNDVGRLSFLEIADRLEALGW